MFFCLTVKTCSATDVQLDHGKIVSRSPHYFTHENAYSYRYTQGVEVKFACDNRYTLEGSAKRRCLENGQWDGNLPHCGKW